MSLDPLPYLPSDARPRQLASGVARGVPIQQLLGSRGIAVHYDIDDYRQDLQTLREHNTPAAIGAIGGVLVSPSHVGYNGVR